MARRGDSHRVVRWLWTSRRPDARLVRLALLPAAALWRGVMATRESAYRRGWLQVHDLPLPSVAIGNLTVGGSGKTPIAIWTARYYVSRGLVPGILLRGYGNDEVLVHQHAVPEAQVVADPDRAAGAERALARGAQVLVLDDAYQRLEAGPAVPVWHLVSGWSRASGLRDGYRLCAPCVGPGELRETGGSAGDTFGKAVISLSDFERDSVGDPHPGKRPRNHEPVPRM